MSKKEKCCEEQTCTCVYNEDGTCECVYDEPRDKNCCKDEKCC